MKKIRPTSTLYYYDGPQVVEARDAIGGHYVAVMVAPVGEQDRYVVAGVEPQRLQQFLAGEIDLRSLMLHRSEDEWFLATTGADDWWLAEPQSSPLSSFSQLPEEGFLLHDAPPSSEALREARARNNLVMEVAAEARESAGEHRIRVGTLAELLTHLQVVVKHAYGAALRTLPVDSRRMIDRSEAHLLDVVVPAAPGSFRIVLEAATRPDLLGQSELRRALERMDELFLSASDPQQTLAMVKAHRGHLAGAYQRLLRFLVDSKVGLRYAWAEPSFAEPRARAISEADAGSLVDALSGVSNLGAEPVELVGALKAANVNSGTWRLATEGGERAGKLKPGGPSLAGLKLEGTYRFTCLEEIEETHGGTREQQTLYLMEHEPA